MITRLGECRCGGYGGWEVPVTLENREIWGFSITQHTREVVHPHSEEGEVPPGHSALLVLGLLCLKKLFFLLLCGCVFMYPWYANAYGMHM